VSAAPKMSCKMARCTRKHVRQQFGNAGFLRNGASSFDVIEQSVGERPAAEVERMQGVRQRIAHTVRDTQPGLALQSAVFAMVNGGRMRWAVAIACASYRRPAGLRSLVLALPRPHDDQPRAPQASATTSASIDFAARLPTSGISGNVVHGARHTLPGPWPRRSRRDSPPPPPCHRIAPLARRSMRL
jgi:hypothetical protein